MSLTILGNAIDYRTDTTVVYAQIPISDYLTLVGTDFDQFEIQRKKEKYRAYERLKSDIKGGTLLPSITLAVKPELVDQVLPLVQSQDRSQISVCLGRPNQVQILDGLQRTYVLSELHSEGFQFDSRQTLLLEFWLERELRHLIYRIIVLNAGRKPMSMRHQVELLFLVIKEIVETQIPGLELYQERDQTRRRGPKKYALDRIAMAYQCFLLKSHEVQRESIVAQELAEGEILDSSEQFLNDRFTLFSQYLESYADIDGAGCRVYSTEQNSKGLPTGAAWFGSETTLNSFFAALSDFGTTDTRLARIDKAIPLMADMLNQSQVGEDPLGLETLDELVKGLNPRKVNIGSATRRLYFTGFKEFFREEGEKPMKDCWLAAAE